MDKRFGKLAFEMAKRIQPVGAARIVSLLIRRNEIISIGYNHLTSHPFQKRFSSNPDAIYWHAEVHAIHQALKSYTVDEIGKATMLICRARRINGTWEHGLSKPCSGCMVCIKTHRIPMIVYSINGESYATQNISTH